LFSIIILYLIVYFVFQKAKALMTPFMNLHIFGELADPQCELQ